MLSACNTCCDIRISFRFKRQKPFATGNISTPVLCFRYYTPFYSVRQENSRKRRCQVVVGKNEQLKKWVAQLPVGVKGKMNGVPPLTPTDICAAR